MSSSVFCACIGVGMGMKSNWQYTNQNPKDKDPPHIHLTSQEKPILFTGIGRIYVYYCNGYDL